MSGERDRAFRPLDEGRYVLTAEPLGLEFEIDRLRVERHEWIGELTVRCDVAGVRTVDGVLSFGTFNLSSVPARATRANLLREQSELELPFKALLEELCQRVIAAERNGSPSRPLHTYARPGPEAEFDVNGLRLLRHHNQIWFGDGGSLKSYLALYGAGQLAQSDTRVLFADWELSGEDHRERLERLFGPSDMPAVDYMRCDRPLVDEVDRIRRCVRQQSIDFVIYDSIAPACGGPPEAAEHATAYFRAVRQIGVGGLHLAHINKSENGDQKPFGSSFWHNLARATWNVKQASASDDGACVSVGLFNRKANLTRLYPAVGLQFTFDPLRTTVARVNLADVEDLAGNLPLWQRIKRVVRAGPQTLAAIASELNHDNVESLDRIVRKHKHLFTKVSGHDGVTRIAVVERRAP